MKTIRLVLLLVFILLALLGTSRAAGEAPDPSKTYLPLILNNWVPVTQTRFHNGSQDLILSLKVDGVEQITGPLPVGAALTIPLSAGEHEYAVELGRLDSGASIVYYRWSKSFTQEPGQTVYIEIAHPSMAAVLSDFGIEKFWKTRTNSPGAPTGFCFYPDFTYRMYQGTACTGTGTVRDDGLVGDTRAFTLLDETQVPLYGGTYHFNNIPFFGLYEAGDPTISIDDYDHFFELPCPADPDECGVSTD